MKTKFEEFLKEYREVFNTDLALKKLLKKAFGEESYNEKEIVNKIYNLSKEKTLPTAVESIIKDYPVLKKFKGEIIAILEDNED